MVGDDGGPLLLMLNEGAALLAHLPRSRLSLLLQRGSDLVRGISRGASHLPYRLGR